MIFWVCLIFKRWACLNYFVNISVCFFDVVMKNAPFHYVDKGTFVYYKLLSPKYLTFYVDDDHY